MSAPAWQRYDRAELDRQYDTSGTVPSLDPYFERYAAQSARVRDALGCRLDIPYGYEPRTKLDLFPAQTAGAPAVLYVHGGWWRRLGREYFDFIAEPIVEAGGAAAICSYTLAPGASIDQIVQEVRWAFAWLHANAPDANANAAKLHVVGHSAGGQLVGMLAATDWSAFGMPIDAVKSVTGISGLYDLEPVRLSFANEWLALDAEAALRNSPSTLKPAVPTPLLTAAGVLETDEFRRQARDFAAAWQAAGSPATYLEVAGCNHYDVVLDILQPENPLRQAILRTIGLPRQ